MNNVVAGGSEFSSGCESGWTVYLEKSWLSPNCSISYDNNQGEEDAGVGSEQMRIKGGEDQEEEEDMSMVSDASSGPPHFNNIDYSGFNNHQYGCFNPTGGEAADEVSAAFGRRKKRNNDVKKQRMLLDDTASSRPVSHHHLKKSEIGFGHRIKNQSQVESHSMLDLSHGFSTTHIQVLGRKLDGVQVRAKCDSIRRSVEK
ncbi:hypothetical protein QQ045_023095 [Rhodiola kirilowii]